MKTFLQKNQLLLFLALTFIISWYPWYTGGHGFKAAGPSLAGLIVVLIVSGWEGIKVMLRRLVKWRVKLGWWAIALLGPLALTLIAIAIHLALGGESPSFVFWKQEAYMAPLLILVLLSPMGGAGGEEPFGWRGYAQPKLLERWGKWAPLSVSLIIGAVWAIWHLPEFFNPSSTQYAIGLAFFVPMLIMWIANSIIMTWLYNKTGGSVLVSGVAYHLMLDLSSATLLADFSMSGMVEGIPQLDLALLTAQIAVFAVAALILVITTKGLLSFYSNAESKNP